MLIDYATCSATVMQVGRVSQRALLPTPKPTVVKLGGALRARSDSWFEILSHLRPLPQRWISNRFEIEPRANHLIALGLAPLELAWPKL